jgi:hypothetical protein
MIVRRSHGPWFFQVSFCCLTHSTCLFLRATSAIGRAPNGVEDPSGSSIAASRATMSGLSSMISNPHARTKGKAPKSLSSRKETSSFPRVFSSLRGKHVEMYPAVSRIAGVNISRFSKVRGISTAVRRRLARLSKCRANPRCNGLTFTHRSNKSARLFLTALLRAWEKVGQVPNVVFVEGMVQQSDRWLFYYGGADKYVGVAAAAAVRPQVRDTKVRSGLEASRITQRL